MMAPLSGVLEGKPRRIPCEQLVPEAGFSSTRLMTPFIHRRFTLSPNNLLGFAIGRFALDAAA